MMVQSDFQNALIAAHKGEKSLIEISVDFNNFKSIQYDVKDVLGSFNTDVNLQKKEDQIKGNIKSLLNFQARQMVIYLFDILQNSKYNKYLNRTEIFKFIKYIRNGAAHNNKFNFDKPLKNSIRWRNKVLDNSLKGKEVFPSFITPGDLILLISDISHLISDISI